MEQQIYTPVALARMLNVSYPTVRRWLRDGRIKCSSYPWRHRIARRVTSDALVEFFAENTVGGEARYKPNEVFHTVAEVALRAGVCRPTVRRWLAAGRIRHLAVPCGGRTTRRIPESDLAEFLVSYTRTVEFLSLEESRGVFESAVREVFGIEPAVFLTMLREGLDELDDPEHRAREIAMMRPLSDVHNKP